MGTELDVDRRLDEVVRFDGADVVTGSDVDTV